MKKVIVAFILAFGVGMADELVDECIKDKSGKSCFELGIRYLIGEDLNQAEFFIKKACERIKAIAIMKPKLILQRLMVMLKKRVKRIKIIASMEKSTNRLKFTINQPAKKTKAGFSAKV